MRRGELWGLKWDQVNFEQGIISLFDTKNGERRDVPMNETVKVTLKGIERRGEQVFDFRNFRKAWEATLRKSGIKDFRFHDLRHTFASTLVMGGAELNDVRELLGHKKMDMTLRYSHLAPKYKAKAVNILDQAWSQISPQTEKAKKIVSLSVGKH